MVIDYVWYPYPLLILYKYFLKCHETHGRPHILREIRKYDNCSEAHSCRNLSADKINHKLKMNLNYKFKTGGLAEGWRSDDFESSPSCRDSQPTRCFNDTRVCQLITPITNLERLAHSTNQGIWWRMLRLSGNTFCLKFMYLHKSVYDFGCYKFV